MPKALIVVDSSQYNINIMAAKHIGEDLRCKGYEPAFINMMSTDNADVLKYHMVNAGADLLVTLDCAGFSLDLLGGDLFYNSLCIPAAHVLLSGPAHFTEQLAKRMNFTMDFYVLNQEDINFMKKNFFRVHNAFLIEDNLMKNNDVFPEKAERPIDIVIPEVYIPSEYYAGLIAGLPQNEQDAMMELLERASVNRSADIYEIMENCRREHDIQTPADMWAKWCMNVLLYVKSLRIEQAVDFMLRENIAFSACGRGWDCHKAAQSLNILGKDGVGADELKYVLGQSKCAVVSGDYPGMKNSAMKMLIESTGCKVIDTSFFSEHAYIDSLMKLLN